ncbi:hypothetical protein YB2330_006591 [Saitoella coloradoensis]
MDRSQPHSQHQALDHEAIRLQLDEIQSYLASITPNDPLSAEIIPVYRVYLEEMREVLRRETGERHDYLETELPTYGDAVEEGPAPAYVAEPEEERVLDEGIVNDMDGLDEFRDFVERRGLALVAVPLSDHERMSAHHPPVLTAIKTSARNATLPHTPIMGAHTFPVFADMGFVIIAEPRGSSMLVASGYEGASALHMSRGLERWTSCGKRLNPGGWKTGIAGMLSGFLTGEKRGSE